MNHRNQWTGPTPAIERLMSRVTICEGPLETSCWISSYAGNNRGYASIQVDQSTRTLIHRFAYEYFRGPIPEGLEIDHLCRTPRCCNPDHLEVVTHRENTLRSAAPAILLFHANLCMRGHSLVGANVNPRGHRSCRICRRVAEANRRARVAARSAA